MILRWPVIGWIGMIASMLALGPMPASGQAASPGRIELQTLSTRPALVTGGQVLVELRIPPLLRADQVSVRVDGRDVTTAFKSSRQPQSRVGLVTGLPVGHSRIEARAGGQAVSLDIVNHPISGPVLLTPAQTPFACQTQGFGLGDPLDANCSVPTKVEYLYRSTVQAANPFKPYPSTGPRPADVAMTTTLDGKTVRYIVRREMGTINRAVYMLAFLHEPNTPLPNPWTSESTSWNGRLVYSFGGGCGGGYRQGTRISGFNAARSYLEEDHLGDYALAKGYAVAGSSLNVFGTSCNDVLSAETLIMVKEHFIEQYGVPRHTIGIGRSGGSMAQYQAANNYPGVLDGILPLLSFPDVLSFFQPLSDCELLKDAFQQSGVAWTEAEQVAVAGAKTWEYCRTNGPGRFALARPAECDTAIPAAARFDPSKNPSGVRCTYQDNLVHVFGRDRETGYARRPLDNVGVQYGLLAFNRNLITFEQFAALNRAVGGYDANGQIVRSRRMVGDPEAIELAHRTGRISHGSGLAGTPIIDVRPYTDLQGDIHDAVRTDVMRARLLAANGSADNYVAITSASLGVLDKDLETPDSPFRIAVRSSFEAMDRWLSALKADHAPAGAALEQLVRHKPKDLVDACYTRDAVRVTDIEKCRDLFPAASSPRLMAGEPLRGGYLKCRLKPVDPQDYLLWTYYTRGTFHLNDPLKQAQLDTLGTIFPDGVCDYREKGAGEAPNEPWLSYGESKESHVGVSSTR